mgnify:CR=1 FL=1
MLNSFGRLLIWLGVAAFVAPLIMTAVVLTKTTFALNSAFSKLDEAGEIGTTLSKSEIKQRTRALKSLLAPQSLVPGAAASLTIAAVTFDMRNRARFERAQALSSDPDTEQNDVNDVLSTPHAVSIDYGDATRRAVVLISNESLALDVSATNPASAIAVLGLEAKAFPDVSKLKPGMLAGFKVEAGGSKRTALPVDLVEASYTERTELCQSIRSWTRHFGLTSARVDFVVFKDPSHLSFDGSKWVSDGGEGTRLFDSEIVDICE